MAQAASQKRRPLSEEELLKKLLMVSIFVHAVVFVVRPSQWFKSAPIVPEEWTMDADLISDLQLSSPKDTALPKAAPAEEAAVRPNMLPQITKKVAIEDAQVEKTEKTMADPDAPAKEEPKPEAKPEAVAAAKSDPEEQNRLKMEDALKRLALEKLKNEKKIAKETMAPINDDLARLKENMAKNKNVNAGVVGNGQDGKRCVAMIHQAIKRNYALPDAYNLKDAKIVVTIGIVLTDTGELVKSDIVESSGDSVFDQLAFKAVRDSAPLPPCPEQSGKEILIKMSP